MSYKDMDEGHFHFIPLNEFGPEELEWTHRKCYEKDRSYGQNSS
jgi:hypothetical protein